MTLRWLNRRLNLFLATSAALLLLASVATAAPSRDAAVHHWVSSWVSTQQVTEPNNLPPPPGLVGQTIRQIIQPSLGGTQLRVTFSNVFGDAPLAIGAAHVAHSLDQATVQPGSDHSLSFDGRPSVTIQPGASVISDPVTFDVEAFKNLAISAYLTAVPKTLTGHPGSRTTSFIVEGDKTAAADLADSRHVDHWYGLSALDVSTDTAASAVVVLGDSITDGRGSTTNQNDRWPNLLARRLRANPATSRIAVLNQGAGGNRVLRDGIGPNALARFDRDVLAPAGVRWLVVLEGVNDIGTAAASRQRGEAAATAEDLIAAYRQMIVRAHSHGIRVIGATILPFGGFSMYFTPQSESDRQTVNRWIRTSGEFDGVIDFDATTRDPQNPDRLLAAVDGGDHLHPSAAGYRIMADSIDLALFATP